MNSALPSLFGGSNALPQHQNNPDSRGKEHNVVETGIKSSIENIYNKREQAANIIIDELQRLQNIEKQVNNEGEDLLYSTLNRGIKRTLQQLRQQDLEKVCATPHTENPPLGVAESFALSACSSTAIESLELCNLLVHALSDVKLVAESAESELERIQKAITTYIMEPSNIKCIRKAIVLLEPLVLSGLAQKSIHGAIRTINVLASLHAVHTQIKYQHVPIMTYINQVICDILNATPWFDKNSEESKNCSNITNKVDSEIQLWESSCWEQINVYGVSEEDIPFYRNRKTGEIASYLPLKPKRYFFTVRKRQHSLGIDHTSLPAFDQPDSSGRVVTRIRHGAVITVIGERGTWRRVVVNEQIELNSYGKQLQLPTEKDSFEPHMHLGEDAGSTLQQGQPELFVRGFQVGTVPRFSSTPESARAALRSEGKFSHDQTNRSPKVTCWIQIQPGMFRSGASTRFLLKEDLDWVGERDGEQQTKPTGFSGTCVNFIWHVSENTVKIGESLDLLCKTYDAVSHPELSISLLKLLSEFISLTSSYEALRQQPERRVRIRTLLMGAASGNGPTEISTLAVRAIANGLSSICSTPEDFRSLIEASLESNASHVVLPQLASKLTETSLSYSLDTVLLCGQCRTGGDNALVLLRKLLDVAAVQGSKTYELLAHFQAALLIRVSETFEFSRVLYSYSLDVFRRCTQLVVFVHPTETELVEKMITGILSPLLHLLNRIDSKDCVQDSKDNYIILGALNSLLEELHNAWERNPTFEWLSKVHYIAFVYTSRCISHTLSKSTNSPLGNYILGGGENPRYGVSGSGLNVSPALLKAARTLVPGAVPVPIGSTMEQAIQEIEAASFVAIAHHCDMRELSTDTDGCLEWHSRLKLVTPVVFRIVRYVMQKVQGLKWWGNAFEEIGLCNDGAISEKINTLIRGLSHDRIIALLKIQDPLGNWSDPQGTLEELLVDTSTHQRFHTCWGGGSILQLVVAKLVKKCEYLIQLLPRAATSWQPAKVEMFPLESSKKRSYAGLKRHKSCGDLKHPLHPFVVKIIPNAETREKVSPPAKPCAKPKRLSTLRLECTHETVDAPASPLGAAQLPLPLTPSASTVYSPQSKESLRLKREHAFTRESDSTDKDIAEYVFQFLTGDEQFHWVDASRQMNLNYLLALEKYRALNVSSKILHKSSGELRRIAIRSISKGLRLSGCFTRGTEGCGIFLKSKMEHAFLRLGHILSNEILNGSSEENRLLSIEALTLKVPSENSLISQELSIINILGNILAHSEIEESEKNNWASTESPGGIGEITLHACKERDHPGSSKLEQIALHSLVQLVRCTSADDTKSCQVVLTLFRILKSIWKAHAHANTAPFEEEEKVVLVIDLIYTLFENKVVHQTPSVIVRYIMQILQFRVPLLTPRVEIALVKLLDGYWGLENVSNSEKDLESFLHATLERVGGMVDLHSNLDEKCSLQVDCSRQQTQTLLKQNEYKLSLMSIIPGNFDIVGDIRAYGNVNACVLERKDTPSIFVNVVVDASGAGIPSGQREMERKESWHDEKHTSSRLLLSGCGMDPLSLRGANRYFADTDDFSELIELDSPKPSLFKGLNFKVDLKLCGKPLDLRCAQMGYLYCVIVQECTLEVLAIKNFKLDSKGLLKFINFMQLLRADQRPILVAAANTPRQFLKEVDSIDTTSQKLVECLRVAGSSIAPQVVDNVMNGTSTPWAWVHIGNTYCLERLYTCKRNEPANFHVRWPSPTTALNQRGGVSNVPIPRYIRVENNESYKCIIKYAQEGGGMVLCPGETAVLPYDNVGPLTLSITQFLYDSNAAQSSFIGFRRGSLEKCIWLKPSELDLLSLEKFNNPDSCHFALSYAVWAYAKVENAISAYKALANSWAIILANEGSPEFARSDYLVEQLRQNSGRAIIYQGGKLLCDRFAKRMAHQGIVAQVKEHLIAATLNSRIAETMSCNSTHTRPVQVFRSARDLQVGVNVLVSFCRTLLVARPELLLQVQPGETRHVAMGLFSIIQGRSARVGVFPEDWVNFVEPVCSDIPACKVPGQVVEILENGDKCRVELRQYDKFSQKLPQKHFETLSTKDVTPIDVITHETLFHALRPYKKRLFHILQDRLETGEESDLCYYLALSTLGVTLTAQLFTYGELSHDILDALEKNSRLAAGLVYDDEVASLSKAQENFINAQTATKQKSTPTTASLDDSLENELGGFDMSLATKTWFDQSCTSAWFAGGGRESFLCSRHEIPMKNRQFSFDVIYKRQAVEDEIGLEVGLFSRLPSSFEASWGNGSVVLSASDGSIGHWNQDERLMNSHIVIEPNAPVDVRRWDSPPPYKWDPGRIMEVGIENPNAIRIEVIRGDDTIKSTEWTTRDSPRLAPPGSRTNPTAQTTGFLRKKPYIDAVASSNEAVVVSCTWDRVEGSISFSINGKPQGVAATNVFGRFHPAICLRGSPANVSILFHPQSELNGIPEGGNRRHIQAYNKLCCSVPRQSTKRGFSNPRCGCWKRRNAAIGLKEIFTHAHLDRLIQLLQAHDDDIHNVLNWAFGGSSPVTVRHSLLNSPVSPVSKVRLENQCKGNTHMYCSQLGRFLDHRKLGGALGKHETGLYRIVHASSYTTNGFVGSNENDSDIAVLVQRGENTVEETTRTLQQAGAKAVVVVSGDDLLDTLPDVTSDDCNDIVIPTTLITRTDGEAIQEQLLNAHEISIEIWVGGGRTALAANALEEEKTFPETEDPVCLASYPSLTVYHLHADAQFTGQVLPTPRKRRGHENESDDELQELLDDQQTLETAIPSSSQTSRFVSRAHAALHLSNEREFTRSVLRQQANLPDEGANSMARNGLSHHGLTEHKLRRMPWNKNCVLGARVRPTISYENVVKSRTLEIFRTKSLGQISSCWIPEMDFLLLNCSIGIVVDIERLNKLALVRFDQNTIGISDTWWFPVELLEILSTANHEIVNTRETLALQVQKCCRIVSRRIILSRCIQQRDYLASEKQFNYLITHGSEEYMDNVDLYDLRNIARIKRWITQSKCDWFCPGVDLEHIRADSVEFLESNTESLVNLLNSISDNRASVLSLGDVHGEDLVELKCRTSKLIPGKRSILYLGKDAIAKSEQPLNMSFQSRPLHHGIQSEHSRRDDDFIHYFDDHSEYPRLEVYGDAARTKLLRVVSKWVDHPACEEAENLSSVWGEQARYQRLCQWQKAVWDRRPLLVNGDSVFLALVQYPGQALGNSRNQLPSFFSFTRVDPRLSFILCWIRSATYRSPSFRGSQVLCSELLSLAADPERLPSILRECVYHTISCIAYNGGFTPSKDVVRALEEELQTLVGCDLKEFETNLDSSYSTFEQSLFEIIGITKALHAEQDGIARFVNLTKTFANSAELKRDGELLKAFETNLGYERIREKTGWSMEQIESRLLQIRIWNELYERYSGLIDMRRERILDGWCLSACVSRCRPLADRKMLLKRVDSLLKKTCTTSLRWRPTVSIDRWASPKHGTLGYYTRTEDNILISPANCRIQGKTVFEQAFEQLGQVTPERMRQQFSCPHIAFEVVFPTEHVAGEAGPWREFFTSICRELQLVDATCENCVLTLFIPTPNQQIGCGEHRDRFIPRPSNQSLRALNMYRFFGRLVGCAMRSGVVLPLDFPPLFWKHLCSLPVDRKDLEEVDLTCVTCCEQHNESGAGADETVMLSDRVPKLNLSNDVITERLYESSKQIEYIRLGLGDIIPTQILHLVQWDTLETLVCGNPIIDVDLLRRHTEYGAVSCDAPHILAFWQVLGEFTNDQRKRFIKFVWGQERLPQTGEEFEKRRIRMLIKSPPGNCPNDHSLPRSDTCFFNLELPIYSTKKILRERLLLAINLDFGLDGDDTF